MVILGVYLRYSESVFRVFSEYSENILGVY